MPRGGLGCPPKIGDQRHVDGSLGGSPGKPVDLAASGHPTGAKTRTNRPQRVRYAATPVPVDARLNQGFKAQRPNRSAEKKMGRIFGRQLRISYFRANEIL